LRAAGEANHSLVYMMMAAILALSARLSGKTVAALGASLPGR
jgi:hypothetical protein